VSETLIRQVSLLGGKPHDVAIKDGVFVNPDDVDASGAGTQVIDAGGLIALPGLVDLHTHLRQPGMEQAETVLSGSQAAAAGGFTAVFAMANTQPVADSVGVTDMVHRLGQEAGYVDVRPIGAVSKGLAGEELAGIAGMASGVAKVRVFSDDGHCVSDSLLMRRALEYVATFGGVIAQHAQDPRLTEDAQINEGALSSRLGLAGWPAVAEEAIIARDILLAEYTRSRLHICHLSTKGSVEIVRAAKAKGLQITAEVTPHHLLLTEDLTASFDPLYKVNPPLRHEDDVQALRQGVADGTIDIVATDHAPHPSESKDCAFDEAAFGMLGLEVALSVVQKALVEPGHLDWTGVARVLSRTPAQIGGLTGYETPCALGAPAHLTLVDPQATRKVHVRHSRSGNNPYSHLTLPGDVRHTFFHGNPTVVDGDVVAPDELRRGRA
jgi:dihydroorotase